MIGTTWTGRQFDYSKKLAERERLYLTIFLAFLTLVIVAMSFVIYKNVKLGKKLKEMAYKDAMTGIFNRRHFLELTEMQISRSIRTEIDCFVIIFDLDHFKKVNDTYGHLAGDKVLIETAQRVKKNATSL